MTDTITLDRAREFLAKPEPLRRETERHRRAMKRLRRGEELWSWLESLDLIYLLGGARSTGQIVGPHHQKGIPWTDCSGAQLFDMRVMGLNPRFPAGWTGTLVQEGHEGVSPYFTLFLKEPEQTEGHVIARRRHKPHLGDEGWRWTECGGNDNPHPGGGPTWFHPTAERVAEFPYQRHFAVLA